MYPPHPCGGIGIAKILPACRAWGCGPKAVIWPEVFGGNALNLIGVKCEKCGLIQMAKETCKSCGRPLGNPLDPLRPPRVRHETPAGAEATPAVDPDAVRQETRAGAATVCCECGKPFPADEMIQYGPTWVCAGCKPVFVQKLRQGMSLPGIVEYAGFWARFGAKTIDGLIIGVVSFAITMIGGIFLIRAMGSSDDHGMLVIHMIMTLFQYLVAATYATWFVGKFGATPGKMACKLKIVTADGGKVSYGKALGRHFSEYLSVLTFMIGYLMSAFDAEKRALHDRMCNTRVIKA